MTPGKIICSESSSLPSPTPPPRRRALLTQTLPTPRPGWRGWESPCPRRRKWKVTVGKRPRSGKVSRSRMRNWWQSRSGPNSWPPAPPPMGALVSPLRFWELRLQIFLSGFICTFKTSEFKCSKLPWTKNPAGCFKGHLKIFTSIFSCVS